MKRSKISKMFLRTVQEPLDIPSRQNVLKVPQINWEAYSGAMDDFSQLGLLHQHNTRHSTGPAVNLERGKKIGSLAGCYSQKIGNFS
jgi:hypothetical protein